MRNVKTGPALACLLTLPALARAQAPEPAAVAFPRGEPAHVVAAPKTPLEERITGRLTAYLDRVLGRPTRVVRSLAEVPAGKPAVVLASADVAPPFSLDVPDAPEGFALATGTADGRPVAVASGRTDRGLKRAVQRLILRSDQRAGDLAIPPLRVAEKPWIPAREWTICPWTPQYVRGVFVNPDADRRMDITRYDDRRLADYVEMFDQFGYSGSQLIETCYTYAVMGSIEAAQQWQRKIAGFLRENGQEASLWAWCAQFDGYGWTDPVVAYTPAPGVRPLDDPRVRRGVEKYYDHYAALAPSIDRFFGHFFDPGQFPKAEDTFDCLRLLEKKLKARNPAIRMGVDAWAADADHVLKLGEAGFRDYGLLEVSLPEVFGPGRREKLHEAAAKQGLSLGVWGWYMTEYETDQLASMYVNSKLLKRYYTEIRDGAYRIHPIAYWSEMEAHHLNDIYSMYVAGQLLWNPDRDPEELLREVTEGIWGPANGPVVRRALALIEDARTGPSWETYWWTRPTHRVGTDDAAADLKRAEESLAALGAMKTDAGFVPKFALPYPPAVFVELMIPHVRQIRDFATFRIKIAALRERAKAGAAKEELEKALVDAWRPVPEYGTWVGVFGSKELREQKKVVGGLRKEFGLSAPDPAALRYLEADRLLQGMRARQAMSKTPVDCGTFEFFWPPETFQDRYDKLVGDGVVTRTAGGKHRLADWEFWAP